VFPLNTTIEPGGYLVIDAAMWNPADAETFLNPWGGDFWLFAANQEGELTGYQHGFRYTPPAEGRSFGRLITSTGEEYFPMQRMETIGAVNSGPLSGPAVIAEIMYHPVSETDTDYTGEYIKIVNTGTTPLSLYDPGTGPWAFTDGIRFTFGEQDAIPPRGVMLLVSFDPAYDQAALTRFMQDYSIDDWHERVRIKGPYSGRLSNSGETLQLVSAGGADVNGMFPRVVADSISYLDSAPWPGKADGEGEALTRDALLGFANDPSNWSSEIPSPGIPLEWPPIQPPAIIGIGYSEELFFIELAEIPPSFKVQTTNNLNGNPEWIDIPATLEQNKLIILNSDNPFEMGISPVFYRVIATE
jgi:hypothetical protein